MELRKSTMKKDRAAIQNFLRPFYRSRENPYLAFSGGKDSITLLDAVSLWGIPIIHNPKDNTHPETIKFIYEVSKIHPISIVPSKLMPEWIKFYDYTCQIDGTRISEFCRKDKSTDVIINGENVSRTELKNVVEKGIWGIMNIFPIFDWEDEDVYAYIRENKVPYSKEYEGVI